MRLGLSMAVGLALAGPAAALEPNEVALIVNRNMPASRAVADHYCAKRGVPAANVLAFDLPTTEDVSRRDYNERLAGPLRKALAGRRDAVKALLCVYGVPLRVGGDEPSAAEKAEVEKLRPEVKALQGRERELQKQVAALVEESKKTPKGPADAELAVRRKELKDLQEKLRPMEQKQKWLSHSESQAAVDSELMLLWWGDYELRRWQANPLYFQAPESARSAKPPVLLTARLDGPTPEIARRLVDQAVEVEKTGLSGKVYIDARGSKYDPKSDPGTGYGGYDESMRETAKLLQGAGLTVVLDNTGELFPPGSCTDCALYCGWYSHAKFIDCCRFVPGAVAWHLASSEAVSLRRRDQNLWCRNLLEKGACATLGPVAEPYTIGFPKPAEFFGFLATGEYTLAECYGRTVTTASWMGTLIGDPLYNPYRNNPRLKSGQVKPSPAGGRPFGEGR
jgi:uncharacterized protein (TIGR03790 family)